MLDHKLFIAIRKSISPDYREITFCLFSIKICRTNREINKFLGKIFLKYFQTLIPPEVGRAWQQ